MRISCTVRLPALVFVCTVRLSDRANVGLFSRTPSPVIGKWLPCIPRVPVARKCALSMVELLTAARTGAAVTGLGLGTLAKKAPLQAVVAANRPNDAVIRARRTIRRAEPTTGPPGFSPLSGSRAALELDRSLGCFRLRHLGRLPRAERRGHAGDHRDRQHEERRGLGQVDPERGDERSVARADQGERGDGADDREIELVTALRNPEALGQM